MNDRKCDYKVTKEDVFWFSYLFVFRMVPGAVADTYRKIRSYL